MPRRVTPLLLRLAPGLFAVCAMAADAPSEAVLERQFAHTVRPFVTQYCQGCHSGNTPAAQFDLTAYSTMEAVVRDHPHWALVLDKLWRAEMPPKSAPQPPAASRREVVEWIEAVRADTARRNAGDPGPVLARRLSNAEYNYTIRDLTGVDIRPTREFPVDPANPAGFDNSGESLSMSPALLNKYLQAARAVGDHLVLSGDGFGFASHPMLVETDREKYAIQQIVDFYSSQPTDYADYFQAAWRFKHRVALEQPLATLASVAREAKVSSGYLPLVWRILEGSLEGSADSGTSNDSAADVGPIAKLRAMWRSLPGPSEHLREAPRGVCVAMRDFVVKIRKQTATQFVSPEVDGLSATSQPLMNWKLREFASHRRDFDRDALRLASDPPLVAPKIPEIEGLGLGREAEARAMALAFQARAGDRDLVVPDGQRDRYEAAFARFSSVFPDAFYIRERGRFYPDDSEDKGRLLSAGFHNVMGYVRDDTPLIELILDDHGKQELDRLWDEFDFIADFTRRTWIQYFFNQSGEVQGKGRESGTERPSDDAVSASAIIFGLRDVYLAKHQAEPSNDPVAVEAIRDHFQRVNDTLRSVERMRAEAEPRHLDALLDFAERAYRRPLSNAEGKDTLAYYHELREQSGLTHEEAIRDSVVSVLMSPDFLYRMDLVDAEHMDLDLLERGAKRSLAREAESAATPTSSAAGLPLSAFALANRLSYFLWSSMPDEELLAHAAADDLRETEVLLAQTRRMLKDERARGLAMEFAGNWLDFRRFQQHNGVDRERFPSFDDELRHSMFEEPIRFVEDVIRNNRSVLDLLYGGHTFVNSALARHYGIPEAEMREVAGGKVAKDESNWVRIANARRYGRGGMLPMSIFLTKNSPGLRTSPVQRGYWVVRRVLGETIPPPPAVVPELPEDEAKSDLPLRDMLANHRANQVCASCHARFDSFGLAFEAYGPVGETRTQDLAGRPVDTGAIFPDGSQGQGLEGVIDYIRESRQNDYLENFSRKMLAYALSRSLLLSDDSVIDRMQATLAANDYRFASLVETVVTSPQFLNKRSPDPPGKSDFRRKEGE